MGKLSNAKKGSSGTAKKNSAGSTNEKCSNVVCNKTVPPAPAGIMGTCDYYTWRESNFRERHAGCSHRPPVYYLNYGYKYCVRFGTELHPKLSAKGQLWLANARRLLQEYMEEGLKRDMALELDSNKFKEFAFNTHPDAYWDAELANVPWFWDKFQILGTPDLAEWKDGDTWFQAGNVGWLELKHMGKSAAESYGKAKMMEAQANMEMSRAIVEYFRNLFK